MNPAPPDTYIPSPTISALQFGPITLNFYALCILAGIVAAVWLTGRRLTARGGQPGQVLDVVMWAVPFGIIGGRLYHVITDYQLYFGPGKDPVDALKIWEGGLGIWGAIALGALGAYIGCRRNNVGFLAFADAAAPAVLIAQALGRWGNWFNNELYGGPTDLPWALQIHEWDATTGEAVRDAGGQAVVLGSYHPTFLYESLWCLGVAALLVWADRRFRLRPGQVFALYVMGYTLGRVWIEMMRVDEANHVLGLRLNVWTSLLVFAFGLAWFVLARRRSRTVSTTDPMESHTSE